MNLITYVDTHIHTMPMKKKKQLRRQVAHKLLKIQPRVLEAKVCNMSENNKIFKYQRKLLLAQEKLT